MLECVARRYAGGEFRAGGAWTGLDMVTRPYENQEAMDAGWKNADRTAFAFGWGGGAKDPLAINSFDFAKRATLRGASQVANISQTEGAAKTAKGKFI